MRRSFYVLTAAFAFLMATCGDGTPYASGHECLAYVGSTCVSGAVCAQDCATIVACDGLMWRDFRISSASCDGGTAPTLAADFCVLDYPGYDSGIKTEPVCGHTLPPACASTPTCLCMLTQIDWIESMYCRETFGGCDESNGHVNVSCSNY